MTPSEMIAKIDAAIGPPDSETDEDHAKRLMMIERDAERRRIRNSTVIPKSSSGRER